MRVNVERLAAQKTDERLPALPRKSHRQTRRRRHRADNRNPPRQGLLHNFKRRPAADQQYMPVKWQQILQKTAADDLVNRVVPANVFTHDDKFASFVEDGRRVQPTSLRESFLRHTQAFG